MEVKIYPGVDGSFTFYEDEFDGYNFEKGKYTTIRFNWDDKNRTLTIGERNGKYSGMIEERVFNIKVVGNENITPINYNGDEVVVKL